MTSFEKDLFPLTRTQVDLLIKRFSPQTFTNPFDIFFEGQSPHLSVLLLSGEVHLRKKKKLLVKMPLHSVLALEELLDKKILDYSAQAQPKSELVILERSEVLSILNNRKDPLNLLMIQLLKKKNFEKSA